MSPVPGNGQIGPKFEQDPPPITHLLEAASWTNKITAMTERGAEVRLLMQ
jgi:hypothetical protein